jgi:hypothetical protein
MSELKNCPVCNGKGKVSRENAMIVLRGQLNWRNPAVELPENGSRCLYLLNTGKILSGVYCSLNGWINITTHKKEDITTWIYESELLKTIGGE